MGFVEEKPVIVDTHNKKQNFFTKKRLSPEGFEISDVNCTLIFKMNELFSG